MTTSPPRPGDLPFSRARPRFRPVRMLVVALAQVGLLLLVAAVFDGVSVDGFASAALGVAVLALLNALVWPLAIRVTAPILFLTVGLFSFVVNAFLVWLMSELVDGLQVTSFWTALLVAAAMALANVTVGGLLNVDDDHVWRQKVVRRLTRRRETTEESDTPGFLFIQIDGLGHDVLLEAIEGGHAPFLGRLIQAGTHRLIGYECDLSSQTGAMQAGILLGNNDDMPAFRWYEKETGEVMVSNRPADAAKIETQRSTGTGLLVDGGASRANVFSGDAPDSMFTFSTVKDRSSSSGRFLYVVATPYALLRILYLMVADIVRERRAYRRARREQVVPILDRGGVYPLLRAGTTVALEEITFGMLLADVLRGAPSVYVDLVGYDEVAHHSGVTAPDALDTLARIDRHLERLLRALDDAPRPYFVVPVLAEESWNNVNGLLTDAASDDSVVGKMVERTTRKRTQDGEVALGPRTDRSVDGDAHDLIVLASGNLGLLSIPAIDGRASRRQIEARYPGMIDGLRAHEGVGFVLVRDELDGDLVLGRDGVHHLADGRIEGTDPLGPFGPNAADHLRRTSSFENCPDLLINGFYDPVTDEGAAFEELIGFHGGLGGRQSHPFILAPSQLPVPDDPLVGAVSVHHLLKSWVAAV